MSLDIAIPALLLPIVGWPAGYKAGTLLPCAGHLRVTVAPAKTTVEYVRAYLPKDERDGRKNGHVEHAYTIP